MLRFFLKSKIHHATVTEVDPHYEGSIGIDQALLESADILPSEKVDIYNITNGARFSTYAIPLQPLSGKISLNGAAARLCLPGDLIIIASYALLSEAEFQKHTPKVILLDAKNCKLSEKLAF
ncbi:MAG: aspartate 1-decarboxylase [Deltaproteobacteria bacterium]|nr:aspartate 1-decarboxylase [Deltaproteobacteria bacterium]